MDYKIPYKEEWLHVHCGSLPEGVAKKELQWMQILVSQSNIKCQHLIYRATVEEPWTPIEDYLILKGKLNEIE